MAALKEEVREFEEAQDIIDEADALCDLIYFAAGRFHEMGINGARIFEEVHRCNMKKQRGELSKRPGSRGHDAVKPPGWTPPDHGWLKRKPVKVGSRVKLNGEIGQVIDIKKDTSVTVCFKGVAYVNCYASDLEVL